MFHGSQNFMISVNQIKGITYIQFNIKFQFTRYA